MCALLSYLCMFIYTFICLQYLFIYCLIVLCITIIFYYFLFDLYMYILEIRGHISSTGCWTDFDVAGPAKKMEVS